MEKQNFNINQMMDIPNYKTLCECYFSLAQNEEIKEYLKMILYEGKFNNQFLCTNKCQIDNPNIEASRRLSIAHLLISNPDTAKALFSNRISFFHGTNGNALPSILKYGLYSGNRSSNEGIDINTGEFISKTNNHRKWVSFTDSYETAHQYSCLSPQNSYNSELSFEVILGTTEEDILVSNRVWVPSDVPEVGIKDSFPKESIRMILVPSDKVSFVKKIAENDSILIMPMYKLEDKFWYTDESNIIYYSEEMFINYKNTKQSKKFNSKDLKELSNTRLIKNIKEITQKIRALFERSDQYGRTK